MIKFYLTVYGKIVSVRGRMYFDGKNFYSHHPEHTANKGFLEEEVVPSNYLREHHEKKWAEFPESTEKPPQRQREKPHFGS